MNIPCHRVCELKNNIKAESTGSRATFYYPGGGSYRGSWLKSQHHNFGVKENKYNLIYDGQWSKGKRHVYGMMRQRLPDGTMERIYMGQWRDNMKSGEGKQFYKDGVYYGWWKYNRRHGLGIKWFQNENIYMGEWQADVFHGLGVLLYADGNRYEGNFARGFKNGEGTFYHLHTGQIQKGVWENDVCKSSTIQDEFRNQVEHPTKYPIPPIGILKPDEFINKLFGKYKEKPNKPLKTFKDLFCLTFVRKMRNFSSIEPKHQSNSKFVLDDLYYSCTCKKLEKYVILNEL